MLLSGLAKHVKSRVLYNSTAKGYIWRSKDTTFASLTYSGNQSTMAVLNWKYQNSEDSIRLERKYALYRLFQKLCGLSLPERREVHNDYINSSEWKSMVQCNQQKRRPKLNPVCKR